jgi:PAS domain S-box-containing protein
LQSRVNEPLKILLVDDRTENLVALEAILLSAEYELVQATSGAEALRAVEQSDFFVILLDIQMPVMDGFETARMIRSNPRSKDVPIVFVSALDRDPKYVELGYKLGAADFVFKPYEPSALRAKVKMLSDLYRKNIELMRSQEELKESESRFRHLVQSVMDYAIFMLDPKGYITSWNEGAKRFKGYDASEIIGKHFSTFYPKDLIDKNHPQYELDVAKHEGRYEEEGWRIRKDGSRFWANVVITAVRNEHGDLVGFAKVTRDLTERKRAEEVRMSVIREQAALEQSKRESERSGILSEATTILASSLDYGSTLQSLAEFVVHQFCDWCTIAIAKPDRTKDWVATAHRDPQKARLIQELIQYYPESIDEDPEIRSVIQNGESRLLRLIDDDFLQNAAKDKRHRELLQSLGCRSSVVVPIRARGKILGAIAFVLGDGNRTYSLTELRLAEEVARRAGIAIDNARLYEAAQAAIRTRDEFMSIASHELKTPLTSLKLQLQMLKRSVRPSVAFALSPEKLGKSVDVSLLQLGRLNRLVDDLLDVTRIQAGKLVCDFEEIDVSALVCDLVDRYRENLRSAGCEVFVHVPSHVTVWADQFRLEQVIVNLLSNAGKYGAGKPVEISVAELPDQRVEIVCRDHGMGIAQDKLGKVFERFERAVEARNISGLGLGLYISREIIQAHHGSIRVESQEGHGSTFIIELPTAQPKRLVPAAIENSSQELLKSVQDHRS